MTEVLPLGARLIRGAKRIGLVVGLPVAVIGVAGSIIWGVNDAETQTAKYDQTECMARKASSGLHKETYSSYYYTDKNGCAGQTFLLTADEIENHIFNDRPPYWTAFAKIAVFGSVVSIIAAAVTFCFCWAIGWVAAGFTSDRNP